MALYKYKAVTSSGTRIEGTHAASSKNEILELIHNSQQYPILIEEIGSAQQKIDLFVRFNKVKSRDVAVLCRQFYTMLHAGVTILNCLEILKHQTENKRLKVTLDAVNEDVQKGSTLSEAMKVHSRDFSDLFVSMVAVGEVSGNLDQIMERMAVHFEKENRMNSKLQSAMVYPAVLGVVAFSVVTFLLVFVMPTFVGMFQSSGVELPMPTRILLAISYGFTHFGHFILLALIACGMGIKVLARTEDGRRTVDQALLKVPVIKGITQKVVTTRFTRTLATLLASGIPLIQAIEAVAQVVGNQVVAADLVVAGFELRKGNGLSEQIRRMGHFPPMVYYMVGIGEESGSLDEVLNRTSDYFDEELETALTKFTALLEPIMIVIMAVLVGGIAVAMVMPMFSMLSAVKM